MFLSFSVQNNHNSTISIKVIKKNIDVRKGINEVQTVRFNTFTLKQL